MRPGSTAWTCRCSTWWLAGSARPFPNTAMRTSAPPTCSARLRRRHDLTRHDRGHHPDQRHQPHARSVRRLREPRQGDHHGDGAGMKAFTRCSYFQDTAMPCMPGLHRLPGTEPDRDTVLEPGELITAVELPPALRGEHVRRRGCSAAGGVRAAEGEV